MYVPKPIDTSDVVLSKELEQLTEQLAENVHDVWALQRINDGWRFGACRDDGKKTTPCLVPYADLPKNEKEYDRNTAIESLKAIMKLGYRIVR